MFEWIEPKPRGGEGEDPLFVCRLSPSVIDIDNLRFQKSPLSLVLSVRMRSTSSVDVSGQKA